jgi:small subunit ribosomal protein S16
MRLQRFGKKGAAFYHVVIADGRAPRDGRFIEKIGTYNPISKPAEINIDFDRALYWFQTGAVPTDTVKAILMYKGVVYKNHLLKGVTKGALTLEQAEAKFAEWLTQKESKINSKKREVELGVKDLSKKRLAEEAKVNAKKAEELAKKLAKAALAGAQATAEVEEVAPEAPEAPEAAAEESTEAPVQE